MGQTSTSELRERARANRTLTAREERILRMMFEAFTNNQIAIAMGTTEQVIKNRVRVIFIKKGVTSRAMLFAKELKRERKATDAKSQQRAAKSQPRAIRPRADAGSERDTQPAADHGGTHAQPGHAGELARVGQRTGCSYPAVQWRRTGA